jgi:hypothetical protein
MEQETLLFQKAVCVSIVALQIWQLPRLTLRLETLISLYARDHEVPSGAESSA